MGLHDDHFQHDEDVIAGTQGVLGGGAWEQVEKVKAKPSGDRSGYNFLLSCQHCARPWSVGIGWEELATCAAGAVPVNNDNRQPWVAHGGMLYPSVYCSGCGQMLQIPLNPDKCAGYVTVGLKMGSVNPDWLRQHQAHVQQQLAAYRR